MIINPGLSEWGLLPLALFDMGTLDVAGVRFDVSGAALSLGGDSVCVISRLMMSDDTCNGDWLPVAMAERSRTGGFRCCGWLYCVKRGVGRVAPPIGRRGRTVVLNQRGVVMYIRIMYTQQGSIKVLQVTGSLLILLIICCCIVLCLRSFCESLHVRDLLHQPLFQLVCLIDNTQCTVTVRNQLQVPWNAPESIVSLDSPGVVVLDT